MPKIRGDLGPLERAIMEWLWDRPGAQVTVRDMMATGTAKGSAYTTVMTVLDRLWRKRFLSRKKVGRAYAYRVRRTREQHVADLLGRVLAGTKDRRALFLGFARNVDRDDLTALREAIRQVERERRDGR
jgi:predicted transcriptional regulator